MPTSRRDLRGSILHPAVFLRAIFRGGDSAIALNWTGSELQPVRFQRFALLRGVDWVAATFRRPASRTRLQRCLLDRDRPTATFACGPMGSPPVPARQCTRLTPRMPLTPGCLQCLSTFSSMLALALFVSPGP